MDECTETPCGDNTRCVNTDGSFTCQCLQGYTSTSADNSTSMVCEGELYTAKRIDGTDGWSVNYMYMN